MAFGFGAINPLVPLSLCLTTRGLKDSWPSLSIGFLILQVSSYRILPSLVLRCAWYQMLSMHVNVVDFFFAQPGKFELW